MQNKLQNHILWKNWLFRVMKSTEITNLISQKRNTRMDFCLSLPCMENFSDCLLPVMPSCGLNHPCRNLFLFMRVVGPSSWEPLPPASLIFYRFQPLDFTQNDYRPFSSTALLACSKSSALPTHSLFHPWSWGRWKANLPQLLRDHLLQTH